VYEFAFHPSGTNFVEDKKYILNSPNSLTNLVYSFFKKKLIEEQLK